MATRKKVAEDMTAVEQTVTARRIVLRQPGPEAPGFLRRQQTLMRFTAGLQAIRLHAKDVDYCPDPRLVDDLVEFLLPAVVEPADRAAARELLLDLSQDEYEEVMAAFAADAKN
jgi:hypothetical protein